jgi:hypothetical protein
VTTLAHGIGQSADLPLPLDLVLQAGAATVVVSFLIATSMRPRARPPSAAPVVLDVTWLRWPVLALSLYLVGDMFAGPANPLPYALFVWLWVGVVPLSVIFGPVWRAVNPLRTLYRLLPRKPRAPVPPVGVWPAAAGLLAFVWFELLAPHRADPLVVGGCLLGYGLLQLGLAAVYGEDWFAHGDFFEVYSTLAGRLSPLRHRHPLAALAELPPSPALAAFLAIWWGSTIFDSVSASPFWRGAGHPIRYGTLALVLISAVVLVAVRRLAGRLDVTASLIPIAVGYTLAHYLTLLLAAGPQGVLVLIQQRGLAQGATWEFTPTPGLVPILQITLILLGHILGVVVAHDMASAAGPDRPRLAAVADELPVVLFMIACTWTGLFLLFVR